MVLLKLSIKAELENVTDLQPASNDFEYLFNVKCTSCNETHPNIISMNRIKEYEVPGGKHGKANFVWKCGFCKRSSSAKFDTTQKVKPYTSENAQFQPLLIVECRGLEFTGFHPEGIWKCVGSNGTVFDSVDLTEGEWDDYDEKAALPVRISEIESEWSRA
ncbi:hypothetical protein AGABI2DRAFT_198135 [Agaricus bisporus var. bisporus H97]|uniref:hypothetical protein n=1 Tax=Agaricus bisporus var. bisporus (strain H97 / ATCC MYA-4626 / FGSC 10389) TaxID=936046 RepID=UPI00029F52E1|nr:hypothetical protein AGABI2DRAFT_198135 [Agaricus bisporus var. bisporus H97]EKV51711.1 hypothetical protein AGABI2DRAFT_198135 [Agaricus bisporus var. bisporus H97]